MSKNQQQEILRVVDQTTGEALFSQPLGEWFRQGLIGRSLWAAAHANPSCCGLRLKAELESKYAADGRILGWFVTLSKGNEPVFRRAWPVEVLLSTALAVGQQCKGPMNDGRVLYWVSCQGPDQIRAGSADGIEFDIEQENFVTAPVVRTRSGTAAGRIVLPAARYPTEAVLQLHEAAYAELEAGIADERNADKELAWAGPVKIWRASDEGVVVYEVSELQRLFTPAATAALCPIPPEELVGLLRVQDPIVFVHTHVIPEGHGTSGSSERLLACSHNDLRCFQRLPVGSLGVVAASCSPLNMRAYGWPTDGGDLSELTIAVTLTEQGESQLVPNA